MSYEDFVRIQEEIQDYEDLRCLREANEAQKETPAIGMAEVKKGIEVEQIAAADAIGKVSVGVCL